MQPTPMLYPLQGLEGLESGNLQIHPRQPMYHRMSTMEDAGGNHRGEQGGRHGQYPQGRNPQPRNPNQTRRDKAPQHAREGRQGGRHRQHPQVRNPGPRNSDQTRRIDNAPRHAYEDSGHCKHHKKPGSHENGGHHGKLGENDH